MANSYPGSGNVTIDKLMISNKVDRAYTPNSFNDTLHAMHIDFCNQNQRAGLIRWTSHGNLENSFGVVQVGCAAAGCGQGDFVFQAYREAGGATYSELMRLTNTGNIGIGCAVPPNKLTIAGANAILGVIASNASDSSYAVFRNTSDAIAGYIGLDGNGLVGAENGSMLMASSAGKSIIFAPALTEKMKITSAGNVGINCTSPGSKLTVGGTLTTTDTITTTSGTVNTIISWNASVGIIGTDTNHGLQIRTCGTERIRITCNGEIGINTTSPGSYKLNVNGAFYAAGSSCEYKTQICQYNTDSCMFMKLTPVTYQYKDEYCHLGKELKSGTQIGLIAEDVAEVYPELAILKDEEDNKVVRNVDYEKLSIILLSELQKLRAEVDELKTK